MNASVGYIVDQPLPETENFSGLKQKGLNHIKTLAGHRWSNFNESDPGVTILDQLCYALTELGYCAEFPIEDILTHADGKIHYQNQFFKPEDILTTAAITLDDYRKLVIDSLEDVTNIYFHPQRNKQGTLTGAYHSYIDSRSFTSTTRTQQETKASALVSRVHALLNQNRNLGEVFLRPKLLAKMHIELAGKITLSKSADAELVYQAIMLALDTYISPDIKRYGYEQLRAQGLDSDDIFNGPRMKNGWISENPAEKRKKVRVVDLSALLANVDGVASINSLSLTVVDGNKTQSEIVIPRDQVASLTPGKQFLLMQNNVSARSAGDSKNQLNLARLQNAGKNQSVEAAVAPYPELPHGNYRDVENYYSIQNTFPDIYGIGPNSIQNEASPYRVAQSRQLKGYLMVYDQMLANQFSQLAHMGELFSFRSEHRHAQDESRKNIYHDNFSSTYFYQGLYQVPYVKPLLLGHDAYHFQYDTSLNAKVVEREAWKQFRQDPFNRYIYGLRQAMETESEAEARRETMLDHLMARHGDDSTLYQDMIRAYQWYMGEAKTRIIVKSIWLQNTAKLSCYRNHAFTPLRANTLSNAGQFYLSKAQLELLKRRRIQSRYIDSLRPMLDKYFRDPIGLKKYAYALFRKSGVPKDRALKIAKILPVGDVNHDLLNRKGKYAIVPTIDGQVDQDTIYDRARILDQDLCNYSTFELKAAILLGLQQFLLRLAEKLARLLSDVGFSTWLKKNISKDERYPVPGSDLAVVRSQGVDRFYEGEQCLMDIVWPGKNKKATPPQIQHYQDHLNQLDWLAQQRKGLILIEHHQLLLNDSQLQTAAQEYLLQVSILYPNYISAFQKKNFRSFFNTLQQEHWPAHVGLNLYSASFSFLKQFIGDFVIWHNGLQKGYGIAKPEGPTKFQSSWQKATLALASLLKLPALSAQAEATNAN